MSGTNRSATKDVPISNAHRSPVAFGCSLAMVTALAMLSWPGLALAAKRPAARASSTPAEQYLGDATSTRFDVRLRNSGRTRIAAVEIARPSGAWSMAACPKGPRGWKRKRTAQRCRFVSRRSAADDLDPGDTARLSLRAITAAGAADRNGAWKVRVSATRGFTKPAKARAEGTGLGVTAHALEILDAVLASTSADADDACPPARRSAPSGAVVAVVVCGRNHSSSGLTPSTSATTLAGTFLQAPGMFLPAEVPEGDEPTVLGSWAAATVAATPGAGRRLTVRVGTAAGQSSPAVTLTGYEGTAPVVPPPVVPPPVVPPPVIDAAAPVAISLATGAVEDAPAAVTLSATDADGDPLSFAIASGPAHGTLGAPSGSLVTYTPAADFNGADSFSYTATDGAHVSAPAAVAVTVDPVNDAPLAQAGVLDAVESTAVPLALGALVSDVETADGTLAYEIVAQPAHGLLTGSGASPIYTPDAGYVGTDSLTFRVTDRGDPDDCTGAPPACSAPELSAIATVAIAVSPDNAAPAASDGAAATDEDIATPIDFQALSSDAETADADLAYEIVQAPAHGDVAAGTYAPDPDYNGPDAFTYRVSDRGDPDNCGTPSVTCAAPKTSATRTVSLTVDAINDAPTLSNALSFVPEDSTQIVALSGGIDDVETAPAVMTYEIVTPPAHGDLVEAGDHPSYTPDAGYQGPDSFTYRAVDRGDPDDCGAPAPGCDGALPSNVATVSLTVIPVNDVPQAAAGAAGAAEDGSTPVDLTALVSDVETAAANLTYEIVSAPAHGDLTGSGGARTYAPDPDYNGPDTFTYRVTDRGDPDNCGTPTLTTCDGAETSATQTVSLTVDAVNDAPALSGIEGSDLPYTENDAATAVTSTLVVSDVDTPIVSATVAVSLQAGDELSWTNQPGITVTGLGPGLSMSGSGSAAAYQALLRSVRYRNITDNPSTADRTFSFRVYDGAALSNELARTVDVTAVNDPPAVTVTATPLSYVESGAPGVSATAAIDNALTVTDPDSATLSGAIVTISGNFTASEDSLTGPPNGQNGINSFYVAANHQWILTGVSSVANYQAALRAIAYRNSSNAPSTLQRTVTVESVHDFDNAFAAERTRAIDVTATNDAPATADESVTAVGNTLLAYGHAGPAGEAARVVAAGNVLTNDSDPEGGAVQLDVANSSATSAHGTVTWLANGQFDYRPIAGYTGADTLTYRVTDAEGTGADGHVSVTVADRVWYVANDAAAGGDGRSGFPFDTLAEAQTASATGDYIYVDRGNGASTNQNSGIDLKTDQHLVGEASALVVGADTLRAAGQQPAIGGNAGNPGVTLATGSTVEGLRVTGVTAPALCAGTAAPCNAAAAANGSTIDNVAISGTGTAVGVSLKSTTGTFSFEDTSVTSNNAAAFIADSPGTLNVGVTSPNLISAIGGPAVSLTNVPNLDMHVTEVGSSGSPTDGIVLNSVSGTFAATSGVISTAAGAGVRVTGGAGTVTYGGAVSNGSGASVVVSGRTGGSVTLSGNISDDADAGGGIDVSGGSAGSVVFSGATKTLSTGAAPAVSLSGGGTVDFTGGGLAITTTSGAGFSDTAPTVSVTGANNTIATGTGTALSLVNAAISSNDLTFRSISSAGAVNGIKLDTTATAGDLVVTGDGGGSANASGGTIANSTGVGVSLVNVGGTVALHRMDVTGGSANKIIADHTDDLIFDKLKLTGGTGAVGLELRDVPANVTVTDSTFAGATADNLFANPVGGGSLFLTVSGSTFSNSGTGIDVVSSSAGTSFDLNLDNNTFTNHFFGGVRTVTTGTASQTTRVTNSSFTDNATHVTITGAENGPTRFDVTDNQTMLRATDSAIKIATVGTQVVNAARPLLDGRIQNNIIGAGGAAVDSGARDNTGISVIQQGDVSGRVLIIANVVRHTELTGILLRSDSDADADGLDGRLDVTLTSNTVEAPDNNDGSPTVVYGIDAEPLQTTDLCMDYVANISAGAGGGVAYRAKNFSATSTFKLERYTGGATDNVAASNFITAQNFAGSAFATAATGGVWTTPVADGACALPSFP